MNILITGAAGLIGSSLAHSLVERGHTVLGIDNMSGGYPENVVGLDFLNRDLLFTNLNAIFEYFKPDYVYHLAAYAAEGLSPFIRSFNYQNNLVATAKVVNECIRHHVRRLVFTSSMAVYGKNPVPFDESQTPAPVDPYGVAKLACEMDIQIAGEQHGLDWCILRPHNVYGPRQNIWDKYRNVLGIWMYQKLHDQPITIFGSGEQQRAFTYIEDCLVPMWWAAVSEEASKQIINIGSSKEYSINAAAEMFKRVVGDIEINHIETRHEVRNAWATADKAWDILKYVDRTGFEEGLMRMWEWAKLQPDRPQQVWKQYEIDAGMYQSWKSENSRTP